MKKKRNYNWIRLFNIGLLQMLLWGILITSIRFSHACLDDKVLWMLICLMGLNYSYFKWCELSDKKPTLKTRKEKVR